MAIKISVYKWILLFLLVWVAIETSYQFYLRLMYMKNGVYHWEEYTLKRNMNKLILIENYFLHDTIRQFVYGQNPDEGTLISVPDSVKNAIEKLNRDLTWGLNLTRTRNKFSIDYNKLNNEKFVIHIEAGANFKASYNGYNLSLIITNDNIISNEYVKFEKFKDENIYVEKNINQEYRSEPFILHYNSNSYDLFILKLFR